MINYITVNIQVLQCVQYWLHQTVGETGQLVIPEFKPLQGVKIFKCLIWDFVDTGNGNLRERSSKMRVFLQHLLIILEPQVFYMLSKPLERVSFKSNNVIWNKI